jgi:hypothetical protein
VEGFSSATTTFGARMLAEGAISVALGWSKGNLEGELTGQLQMGVTEIILVGRKSKSKKTMAGAVVKIHLGVSGARE